MADLADSILRGLDGFGSSQGQSFTGDKLPHGKAMRSLELFGREVLPAIRDA